MAKIFKPDTGPKVTKKEAMGRIEEYDKEMRKKQKEHTNSVFLGTDALLKLHSEDGSSGITFFLAQKRGRVRSGL